jgi:RNA polymerase sigma-19 factor, ECF subfamily
MNRPDNDLIIQFNQGDAGAFSDIYNTYYPNVYQFVRQFVKEREDAQDITADIFVKLWNMRTNITSIKNMQAFLYIAARNSCIDFLRYMKRQQEKRESLYYLLEQTPEEGILPEDIRAEVLQYIYKEIDKLPPNCRKVFSMSYLEGRSTDEIARTLQINHQSVYNHRQRAIKILRMAILPRKIFLSLLFSLGIVARLLA